MQDILLKGEITSTVCMFVRVYTLSHGESQSHLKKATMTHVAYVQGCRVRTSEGVIKRLYLV